MTDPRNDEELVSELTREPEVNARAFDELVARHQGKVVANCRYLTRSPDDAEDLAQEVFVKAYFGLGRFEGRSSFRTWLYRIKINHCLNFLDKTKRPILSSVSKTRLLRDTRSCGRVRLRTLA